MRKQLRPGFTIIEVSLFLAVSGFLLMIMVFGMGSSMKQQQFRDSMQGTAAYINQQYNEIQSGVSNRKAGLKCDKSGNGVVVSDIGGGSDDIAGSSANCVLLGRYYYLHSDRIDARDVVGSTGDSCTVAPVGEFQFPESLQKACATVVGDSFNSAEGHSYGWGNELQNGGGRAAKSNIGFNDTAGQYGTVIRFGIFRDPESGHMLTKFYGDWPSPDNAITSILPDEVSNVQLCFKGQADYYGAIYFGGEYSNAGDTVSGGDNLVSVKIDDSSCGSWAI